MIGSRNEAAIVAFTLLATIADGVLKVALPFIATDLTSSPLGMSALSLSLTLPFLLLSLHVGVLVDRFDRRTILLVTGVVRVVCLAVLTVVGPIAGLPLLYAAGLVLGTVDVIALTAVSALLPNAVPKARWEKVNASVAGIETTCGQFLGPVVGGLLLVLGTATTLGVTAAACVLALACVVVIAGDFRPGRAGGVAEESVHRRIAGGLVFLWRQPVLRMTSVAVGVMCVVWGAWTALIPLIASRDMGLTSGQYGVVIGAVGVGGILGAVAVGRLTRRFGRRAVMASDFAGTVLLGVVPLVTDDVRLVVVSAFGGGFGAVLWSVNARTISQHLVPDEMRGRFSATARLLGWGSLPVGAALGGVLGEVVGVRIALAVLTVPVVLSLLPFLRVMARHRPLEEHATIHSGGTG